MNASGWIYNYDPFPNRTGTRSILNRPCQVVHDDWRGGQVVAIDGAITVRLHLEHSRIGVRVLDRALFTTAGLSPIAGDAIACRVEGHSPEWVVVAVASTHFCGVVGPGTDQAGAVARGQFDPGCVLEPAGAPHTYGVA
jgi:hypothetical protein